MNSAVDFTNVFIALMIGLALIVVMMLYRIFHGPTVFDRLNGLAVVGTDAILLLVLLGILSGRVDMFVDVAIAYSIIGFIGMVIFAKYLEEKGDADV